MEWSMKQKWPTTIIAMQGELLTGKTSMANHLAKQLRCSTIRLDDVVDAIFPGTHPPSPEKADAIMSQAFEIISQIVKTQISLGLCIIVDSPLSRRSHLDKLIRLLTTHVRLIIIECKPRNKYAWQMTLERAGRSSCGNKWYESHNLPIDPEFGRDYTDNDIHPSVSKLVINPTDNLPIDLLAKAVHHLATDDTEGQKIDFQKWWLNYNHIWNQRKQKTSSLCRNKHTITTYKEQGIDYNATCAVCNTKLYKSDSFYGCRDCPLAIHKSCAELDWEGNKTIYTPEIIPKFFLREPTASYCFKEQHLCILCREKSKQFSYDCEQCIFECHLKCGLVPTIVRHQAHVQPLFFIARPILNLRKGSYLCGGCRRPSQELVAYNCKECMVYYHPECALMPALMQEHKHGGYVHDLELILYREKELEDYICDVCDKKMNPEAWYYYCNICYLSMHLDCAFKDFDAWPINEP